MIPVLFVGILLGIAACGKKGPPFLPQKDVPVRVSDLEGEWADGNIVLKGKISGVKDAKEAKEQVKGCRVYYGQYPLDDPPCDGCPIKYQGYQTFGSEVISEEGFRCKLPVKDRGQIYFIEVHLIGSKGRLGPPSNRIKVVVK
jgi:predicted small lipoprotein YifL